jgi:hypothetical protein
MGIYLKKNTVNRFVLTVSESGSLLEPNYLLVFKNQYNTNSVDIPFTTPDLSSSTQRYNLFELIESSTGSTVGGDSIPINLMVGEYTYNVYESTASTLSISATTGVVLETGIMTVDDTTGSFINEIIPEQNNTNPSIYD